MIGFTDSDYAGDLDIRKSTSGYIFTLCGGPVSWMSQRQKIVATSTIEAEYIAASDATKETIWLKHLLESIEIANERLYRNMDNQGAIKLIKNLNSRRTKHVQFHFIREKMEKLKSSMSSDQLADILTNALPRTFSTA